MVKKLLSISVAFLATFFIANAQAPQQLNYQAVVRNAQGQPLANTSVNFQFQIHDITQIDYFFINKISNIIEMEIRIQREEHTAELIMKAKKMGFWIVGTVVENARSLTEVTLQYPLGLVMGSEEKGLQGVLFNIT